MADLTAFPSVDIDNAGQFKYILIKLFSGKDKNFKYIVRGYAWASYHADIYEDVEDKLKGSGIKCRCVGGGRIHHEPNKKKLDVYGYSQGFGQADHKIACDLLKEKYPDYTNITFDMDMNRY